MGALGMPFMCFTSEWLGWGRGCQPPHTPQLFLGQKLAMFVDYIFTVFLALIQSPIVVGQNCLFVQYITSPFLCLAALWSPMVAGRHVPAEGAASRYFCDQTAGSLPDAAASCRCGPWPTLGQRGDTQGQWLEMMSS